MALGMVARDERGRSDGKDCSEGKGQKIQLFPS